MACRSGSSISISALNLQDVQHGSSQTSTPIICIGISGGSTLWCDRTGAPVNRNMQLLSFLVSVYKEMQQLAWLAPCWHATACAFIVCDSTQDTDDGSPLALVYYTPHPCYCYCWRKCVKSAALSTPTRLMPSSKLRRLMQPRKRWLHHARSYTDEVTPVCTPHGGACSSKTAFAQMVLQ